MVSPHTWLEPPCEQTLPRSELTSKDQGRESPGHRGKPSVPHMPFHAGPSGLGSEAERATGTGKAQASWTLLRRRPWTAPRLAVVEQAKLMWQLASARWTDGGQKVYTKEVSHRAQSPQGVLPCWPPRHTIPRKQWHTEGRGNGHSWENPISTFNCHSPILPPSL